MASLRPDPESYHQTRLLGLSASDILEIKKTTRNELAQVLESERNIVISGEDLSRLKREGVGELIEFLQAAHREIIVICYLREPASWFASQIQQWAKGGDNHIPRMLNPDFASILENYQQFVPKKSILVRDFEKEHLEQNCVVQDFCSIINEQGSITSVKAENVSLNIYAVKLLRSLNKAEFTNQGSRRHNLARFELIGKLARVFTEDQKIFPNMLVDRVNYKDLEYLKDNFDLLIKPVMRSGSELELEEILDDLTDINQDDLKKLCEICGLPNNKTLRPQDVIRDCYIKIYSALQ